jgi:hypothetical protein
MADILVRVVCNTGLPTSTLQILSAKAHEISSVTGKCGNKVHCCHILDASAVMQAVLLKYYPECVLKSTAHSPF